MATAKKTPAAADTAEAPAYTVDPDVTREDVLALVKQLTPEGGWPTADYAARESYLGKDKGVYAPGTYTDHRDQAVQDAAVALRELTPKPSHKVVAKALGMQMDHWGFQAFHSGAKRLGDRGQAAKAVAGGLAKKVAAEAATEGEAVA